MFFPTYDEKTGEVLVCPKCGSIYVAWRNGLWRCLTARCTWMQTPEEGCDKHDTRALVTKSKFEKRIIPAK